MDDDNTDPQAQDNASYTSYEGITAPEQPKEDDQPLYRVIGTNRIPVSKHRGPLWHSRYDQAGSAMKMNRDAWEEAYRYYRNDQSSGRRTRPDDQSVRGVSTLTSIDSTENMVFANVSALVPMLYTKNPDCEFTSDDDDDQEIQRVTQRLVNKLAAKKTAPGLNLKRKAKRNIVSTVLTNVGWFECGYTLREQSSEQALEELQKLSNELVNATKQEDIKEVEGKLLALEQTIDMLSPSGPWVKVRRPDQIRIDPVATELDLSDANWAMAEDYMATSLLRAVYGRKKPDSNDWESVFEPTHIIRAGTSAANAERGQTDNFQLFDYGSGDDFKKYGYNDRRAFIAAQMTKVVYVWDRVTRRCELYNANDWSYPLWVWDDPYHLDQFYPFVPMEFHTDPCTMYAKGEVTYYLDQQDDLNLINSQLSKMRRFAAGKLIYDKKAFKDHSVLDAIIAGTSDVNAVGADIEEGKKLTDLFAALLPPSAHAKELFDKRETLETIDRLGGVASVQRGVEYKTNTTNRAIESYESQMQTRADEKMDAIEDSIGGVLWIIAQMCLQFMTQKEVASLLGEADASKWRNMTADEIRDTFTPRVVGGSSLKPSSRAKKEQAMQIVGVLGQFAGASPVAVAIALKVLAKAFDNVTISKDDWDIIYQSLMSQLQGAGGAGGPPQGEAGPRPAQPQPSEKQQQLQQPGGLQQLVQEAAQVIDKLPEEVKQRIGYGLARGTSIQDIAAQVLQALSRGAAQ